MVSSQAPGRILERARALREARAQGVVVRDGSAADAILARASQLRRARRDFKGAEDSRLTMDWPFRIDRADREVLKSLTKLRSRARQLSSNSNIARAFLRLLQSNVIGPKGFRLHAADNVRKSFASWAKQPVTVDRKFSFNRLQRLLIKNVATDGELLVRFYRNFPNAWGFALQVIDADMLDESFNRPRSARENEVRMGIEVDELGAPLAYHIFEDPKGIWSTRGERRRIPADEIIHIYDPDRLNQSRGLTWFLSAMFPTKMLEGYKEAEVTAARIASSKMGFFTPREGATGEMVAAEKDEQGNVVPPEMDAQPGLLEALPPGYTFEAWDPQHPSTAFPAFVKALLRDIASGLGPNYNALTGDFESTSYSSARMSALLDRDQWSTLHEWWADSFLTPVFAEWRTYALLKDAIPSSTSRVPSTTDDVEWIPRGWPWVDPAKDIQASSWAITAGLASRTRILAEQGEDFDEIAQELADEDERAKELGIDITPKGAAFAPTSSSSKDDEEGDSKGASETNGNSNGNGRSRLGALAR